ncbi:precorrin-6y C5,15-methyltransferase (decarboxylating) subunit CbiE [Butyricicoccus sp.]|uniref:precorrin-6y C5,15-methyltransferase (decarboxylating) subunit CbiE n=1 Tax=Butyricicoccus sp. TaxID=2049021 RepID=UPI003D7DC6E6
MNTYFLIGAGMGTEQMLTEQARQTIQNADVVLSTGRLADGLADVRAEIQTLAFSRLAQLAQESTGNIAILLSGDTGFYSAAKSLTEKLRGSGTVELVPGISSIQLFCARFHTSYDDAVLLSLHGRSGALLAPVSYHHKVIMLTGGENKVHVLCQRLVEAGLTHLTVSVAENLGADTERLVSGTPEQLAREQFGDLCVMMTQNKQPTDSSHALRDDDFVRGEVPMTKQEVRWLASSLLSVKPDEVVYDIGAGTGSVTMELARHATRGMVYAVECKSEAIDLLHRNRVHTGCYNTQIVQAMAPDGLEQLPTPDCAFIGGSRGNMAEIVRALKQKNPKIRVLITAIALESLHEAIEALEHNGFAVEISCVNVSRAKKVARYHMMTAQNPVYLIGGNL